MNTIVARILINGRPLAVRVVGSRFNRRFAWVMWAWVRFQAFRGFRPIFRGVRVEWDVPGHARTVPFETAGPSKTQVLIRTLNSIVSPGTEYAFFGVRPNAVARFPQYPGYSIVGEVWRLGSQVKDLQQGQLVATAAPHASLAVVESESVFRLPQDVSPEEAVFFNLGIIALQGIWRGDLNPGENVAVLGRGPIGQLTVQLCHSIGAGRIVSIAPSRRRSTMSLERFSTVIVTSEEDEGFLDAVQADVTYESSGEPQAVIDAIRATRNGGRVVLLGSPRGITQGFDFGQLADRDIRILGAHASTLPRGGGADSRNYQNAGEIFLRLIADKIVDVGDLIGAKANPWESGEFYRESMQTASDWRCGSLRWDWLEEIDRLQKVPYWTFPEMELPRGNWMSRAPDPMNPKEDNLILANGAALVPKQTGSPRSQELRLAVIGCGDHGRSSASDVQNAKYSSLAVVMDLNEDLARQVGETLGVPWTSDYESVLSDPSVDAVFINTPHHLHAEQAVKAASAGKHIIVEKPLAHTLEAASRIVAAARDAKIVLSPWLGLRYMPQVIKAKNLLRTGALGDFLGATMNHHLYKPQSYWERGYAGGISDWRARWDQGGGGVLMMNSLHYLDWLLHLSGLNVTEVSARYATLQGSTEVEDSIVMWLTFENGALATLNSSSCVQGLHQPDSELLEFRMWGTHGHLSLTPPYQLFSSRLVDGKRPERWLSLDPLPKVNSPTIEYLERFSYAILNGNPVEITGEDGLRIQSVIEAAYRSSREGCPVTVKYPEI